MRLALALALASLTTQIAGAQELGMTDFQARRHELRARYAEARTPEAKQRILDEFRQLRLAQGESTAGGAEGDRELADALEGGAGAQERQVGPGQSGLGAGGSQRPDPRIAELEELIAASERELSDALFADYSYLTRSQAPMSGTTIAEATREGVQMYRDYRDELRRRLENGRNELAARRAGNAGTWNQDIDDWRFVLSETGAARRMVADWVRQHFAWRVANDRAELQRLGATLARQREALARIQAASRDAQRFRDAVGRVLAVQEWVERLQRAFEAVTNPTSIPAGVLDEIFEAIDGTDDAIEQGSAVIANHVVQLAAAAEGFENVAEALRAVQGTMELVRQSEFRLGQDLRQMETARQIASAPYFQFQRRR